MTATGLARLLPSAGPTAVGPLSREPGPSREYGQSTVELALLLPILAIGVLIVIQVARVASDQIVLHHAAREAARQASFDPDPAVLTERAARSVPDLYPDRLRVDLGPERNRGSLVEVRVTYRSPTDVLLVGRLIGDVELTATAVVRLE